MKNNPKRRDYGIDPDAKILSQNWIKFVVLLFLCLVSKGRAFLGGKKGKEERIKGE